MSLKKITFLPSTNDTVERGFQVVQLFQYELHHNAEPYNSTWTRHLQCWSVNNLKVRKPIGEGLIFPHGQKALTSVNFSSLSPVSTFLFGGFENNSQQSIHFLLENNKGLEILHNKAMFLYLLVKLIFLYSIYLGTFQPNFN